MSMSPSEGNSRKRKGNAQENNEGNGEDDECLQMVEGVLSENPRKAKVGADDSPNNKKAKGGADDSPNNKKDKEGADDSPSKYSSSVDNGSSSPSPGVDSKSSSFSNEDGESRITKRLKVLCSKQPKVDGMIEIVGARYLLMKLKRFSCHEIERDMEKAVAAAIALIDADHLRNSGLRLFSETQKSIEKAL